LEKPEETSNAILRNIQSLDKLAGIYETKLWYPLVLNIYGGFGSITFEGLIENVNENIKPVKGLVLDVATGPGTYGRRIASPNRTVYGIDLSIGMLRRGIEYIAEEQITNMHFSRTNVEQLPFADGLFDGVLCCGSLHLFPDTVRALGEIGRTMKSGAPLVVITFTHGRKGLLKYKWAQDRVYRRGFHLFPLDEAERCLSETGFEQFEPEVYGSLLLFTARKV
jgi:ubiquinone/menaquinone biosynthesis C-methylase UbiE